MPDHQHQRHRGIDRGGDFVLGPQALVVALPLFGNLEVLAIAADLIAEHGDLEAVGGVVQLEIALFPGERAVHAMRAGHVGGLDEIQRGGVAAQARAQEVFRQRARLRGGGGGPCGIFGQFVFEARQLAERRDLDVVLFLLERAEPAVGPAPEAHARAHDPVGALQAGLAFQEGLGLLVVGELRGLAVAFETVSLIAQKLSGDVPRVFAAHFEIDGSFREGTVKVTHAEPGGGRQQHRADQDEAIVGRAKTFFHVGGLQPGWWIPATSLLFDGPVQADAAQNVAARIHLVVAGAVEQ